VGGGGEGSYRELLLGRVGEGGSTLARLNIGKFFLALLALWGGF